MISFGGRSCQKSTLEYFLSVLVYVLWLLGFGQFRFQMAADVRVLGLCCRHCVILLGVAEIGHIELTVKIILTFLCHEIILFFIVAAIGIRPLQDSLLVIVLIKLIKINSSYFCYFPIFIIVDLTVEQGSHNWHFHLAVGICLRPAF